MILSFFTPDPSVEEDSMESAAILQFHRPLMHLLGPANDEALRGHPLWRRGLDYYSAYQVEHSSLLRRVAVMNYVHPRNEPAVFDSFHHYIVTFQDSAFECLAPSYSASLERVASDDEPYQRMLEFVRARNEAARAETQMLSNTPPLSARLRRWRDLLNPRS